MGRKPNALVSEYFTRGAKCSDTSNRYSHTCKRCGENFPKGRVDSLMSHLLRRCSHTSQVERNFIYRAIQQHNPTPPTQETGNCQPPSRIEEVRQTQRSSRRLSQATSPTQDQSALDTLAEVSRQQLDITSNDRPSQNVDVEHTSTTVEQGRTEQQFYAQLREAVKATPDTHAASNVDQASEENIVVDSISPKHLPTPLIQTASAANQQLEQNFGQDNLDPALENRDAFMREDLHVYEPSEGDHPHHRQHVDTLDDAGMLDPHGLPLNDKDENIPGTALPQSIPVSDSDGPMSWVSTNGPIAVHAPSHNLQSIMATAKRPIAFLPYDGFAVAQTFPNNLSNVMAASSQPISGIGPLRNSTKIRSKFSDNRRKQVQEIRKRGACIRCRMLKKPCSEGTPCNTCKTVGSARLWKGSCLRTRLADEFTLWSTGLFTSKAKAATAEAAQGLEKASTETFVELCLLPRSDSYIELPARCYNQNSLGKQRTAMSAYGGEDPDLVLKAHFEAHMNSPPIYLLDEESGVSTQIEEHINHLTGGFIEREQCPFLKTTLQRAQALYHEEDIEHTSTAPPINSPVRTSYTIQNQLLRNVVELWTSTIILTQSNLNDIRFRLPNQNTASSLRSENIHLLYTQLLSFLETRCASLSKSIISELERRLLQRQQVSRFGTFLSSVILLNCIERTSAFFHFTGEVEAREQQGGDDTNTRELWRQGGHFAGLLGMLLRMRGLVPKTTMNDQGNMVVVQRLPITSIISPSKKQEQEALEMAAEWLDPLGLDFEESKRLRNGEAPSSQTDDPTEQGWDLRFIAGILLPDDGRK